ncbi:MAG: segregation/condensation protein A [Spirochaetaceae bacterium]|jgi:segregation and condensation protein A|nr:segregation/condensation protein A [Spirochaetaceae bacterium]
MDTPQHTFALKDFEGPLDLLLFLIKKNEVNIYDIPIASITEQYLEYLQFADSLNLDDVSEFHNLAATLLFIKSRMLLPVQNEIDDEIEDPREELVEKLIEYQRFKRLSELMEERERDAEWALERQKLQRPLPFAEEEVWEKLDVWDLLKTFSHLLQNMSRERVIDMYEEVSINEKITLMQELLEKDREFSFEDLVTERNSILDIICAFLAVLEAVKDRLISIYQHKMFGDIKIRKYESVT